MLQGGWIRFLIFVEGGRLIMWGKLRWWVGRGEVDLEIGVKRAQREVRKMQEVKLTEDKKNNYWLNKERQPKIEIFKKFTFKPNKKMIMKLQSSTMHYHKLKIGIWIRVCSMGNLINQQSLTWITVLNFKREKQQVLKALG